MTKRIGILGGNFNPIHYGHLFIADQARQRFQLDEVRFMPEYIPPHKKEKTTIAAKHRIAMLELAIAGHSGLAIETLEVDRKGVSYTVDSMRLLREREPDVEFFFIMGGDMAEDLPHWHEPEAFLASAQIIAVARPGYDVVNPYPVSWMALPLLEISSSMIRQFITSDSLPHFLLPERVLSYIEKEGLYR